jgi:hypothetical protein
VSVSVSSPSCPCPSPPVDLRELIKAESRRVGVLASCRPVPACDLRRVQHILDPSHIVASGVVFEDFTCQAQREQPEQCSASTGTSVLDVNVRQLEFEGSADLDGWFD